MPDRNNLVVAVPRGALMPGALDVLERTGLDLSEVRDNDRKLFFPEAGVITMRPSDVPIYVERGSADIGIVGKDVLVEQIDREVLELLDLDFGHCRMVFATAADGDGINELDRRLGTTRIATKYPNITNQYFASIGRRVELIEVKGSIELAAITGLAEGIIDLTATGTTLRENGLTERAELVSCSARLIVNPAGPRPRCACAPTGGWG